MAISQKRLLKFNFRTLRYNFVSLYYFGMGFSLLVSEDHIPVSYDGGFLIWPFMSRRAARKVELPEI